MLRSGALAGKVPHGKQQVIMVVKFGKEEK
jgi:hypothetical protein